MADTSSNELAALLANGSLSATSGGIIVPGADSSVVLHADGPDYEIASSEGELVASFPLTRASEAIVTLVAQALRVDRPAAEEWVAAKLQTVPVLTGQAKSGGTDLPMPPRDPHSAH